jgi:hypothetical protein
VSTVAIDSNRRLLNRTGAGVAGGLLIILWYALWTLTHIDLPKDNHDAILILINTVANAVLMTVGYFFGSSAGVARQGDIIAQQASTADTLAKATAAAAPQPTTTTTIRTETSAPPVQPVAIATLVKPSWITQEEWDKMTHEQKLEAIAKGEPKP